VNVLVQIGSDGLRAGVLAAARAAGYRTAEATSTRESLRCLDEVGARAVIVEVDDASGLRALEAIREAAPQVAVVAIGEEPSVERVVEAFRRGAHDFLRKPFDVGSLERALARHVPPAGGTPEAEEFLASDPAMLRVLAQLENAAVTDATIRIVGESGTGKDRLARRIHRLSPRRRGGYVVVSCAALPPALAESELFGHARGAFTGAHRARVGQIAAADGGTLVLDEIGDLALELQPKLLRVLQERELTPVGSRKSIPVDLRVVATSQRELDAEVAAGRFREDLYYRLDVITLRVPPLRERRADLPLLAEAFLKRFAREAGEEPARLAPDSLARLAARPFRGNVRELENLMRRAALLFPGRVVDLSRLERPAPPSDPEALLASASLDLREMERSTIRRALVLTGGNRTAASRALGISVRTLRNKIRRYQLIDAKPEKPAAGVSP
jgi:DNA-binding NtrC family response regulator